MSDLTLINSTVSGNASLQGNPAIRATKLTAVNSTVAHNANGGVQYSLGVLRNSMSASSNVTGGVMHRATSVLWDASRSATYGNAPRG